MRSWLTVLSILAFVSSIAAQNKSDPATQEQAKQLLDTLAKTPRLARETGPFPMQKPSPDWAVDIVSSVAVDSKGTMYILQRGDKADPIIALDMQGKVLRSWGKGFYNIPH